MRPRCDKDPNFYYDYVALLSTMCCTSKIGIEMMGLWPERIDPGLFQVLSDSLCVLDSKTGVIFFGRYSFEDIGSVMVWIALCLEAESAFL
jgi:hypothetical protein